ncbi:unnamed protein product [Ilex paraguariensis]|uniref:Uncharacterized protein n=1 Tax=Ilex paraguariensis TaxID=185542 RepID=A0ABC8SY98_9AQUA
MVGWQRHLQSILRQTGKRLECSCNGSFSSSPYHSKASLVMGDMPFLRNLQNSTSPSFSSPLYQYLQQLGFTSSSKVLADSSEASPIPSPLTPVLALNSGKTEAQKAVSKPSNVQAILKGIKQIIVCYLEELQESETTIHKLTHKTHLLLGNRVGKCSMSQELVEVWNPTSRGTPHKPGF